MTSSLLARTLTQQLRNIGPVMAQKLLDAGIHSPEQLREIGAEEAYLRIYAAGGFCDKFHASYLYALEGAILDCDWLAIPAARKAEFKAFTQSLKENALKKVGR